MKHVLPKLVRPVSNRKCGLFPWPTDESSFVESGFEHSEFWVDVAQNPLALAEEIYSKILFKCIVRLVLV